MDFDSVSGSDYMNIPSLNLPAAGYTSALADEVRVSLRMLVFSLSKVIWHLLSPLNYFFKEQCCNGIAMA